MPYHRILFTAFLAAVLLTSGCRWIRPEGPISESLATSRQLTQRGIAAVERGRPDKAETLLADAVGACPADSEARRQYAEVLWQRDARPEAIAQLQEAVRLNSEDATLLVRLAEMQLAAGQIEEAWQNAEGALDINPKLAPAWAARGRIMRATGRHQQALADYHRSLGLAPGDREMLLEVAELDHHLGRPQRALATLHALADTYSPGEEPQKVLHLTGLVCMALGRHEEGTEKLAAALIAGDATAEMYYHLGEAELLAGRPLQAAEAARQALALEPHHIPSRELLGRLGLAAQGQAPPRR